MNGEPNKIISIIKALGQAGATVILAILFYYFLTQHFAILKENNEISRKEIEIREQLINTIDRLDRTISSKSVQADIYAAMNGGYSSTTPRLFGPVEYQKDFTPVY